jgi:hypothetical protein
MTPTPRSLTCLSDPLACVCGVYVCVGVCVQVLLAKEWQEVANLQAHSDKVSVMRRASDPCLLDRPMAAVQ